MADAAPNPRVVVGDNAPSDPFALLTESIEDLLIEANNQLDGNGIENEEQEAAVASILTRLRREAGAADDQRKAEKRPHDEAAKAVQEKWAPLLSRAGDAIKAAKSALSSYLVKRAEAQRAAAEALAKEAEEAAEAAALAASNVRDDDLAGRTTVRVKREAAAALQKRAERAAKAPVHATGGERAVGLRSVWTPALVDPAAALKHYRERHPEELKAWLAGQAEKDVRAGARSIPGFTITESKRAV